MRKGTVKIGNVGNDRTEKDILALIIQQRFKSLESSTFHSYFSFLDLVVKEWDRRFENISQNHKELFGGAVYAIKHNIILGIGAPVPIHSP